MVAPREQRSDIEKVQEGQDGVEASEGVIAAVAPPAPPPATVKKLARVLPIPKDLIIDMGDGLAVNKATGRGQCVRKLQKIFEEIATPSQSKRKRATVEKDAKATAVALPSNKRATTREVSVIATAAASAAPTLSVPPQRSQWCK